MCVLAFIFCDDVFRDGEVKFSYMHFIRSLWWRLYRITSTWMIVCLLGDLFACWLVGVFVCLFVFCLFVCLSVCYLLGYLFLCLFQCLLVCFALSCLCLFCFFSCSCFCVCFCFCVWGVEGVFVFWIRVRIESVRYNKEVWSVKIKTLF